MKNLKRLLGLMAISGFAFGFAGNVNAATDSYAETCKAKNAANVAYVHDSVGTHCFTDLGHALMGVKNHVEQGGTSVRVEGNEIVLFKNTTWDRSTTNHYYDIDFDVTINMNGNKIIVAATNGVGITVIDEGNLTINGTGTIDASNATLDTTSPALISVTDGTFTTKGNVTIDYGKATTGKDVIKVTGGTVTTSAGTVVKNAPVSGIVIEGEDSNVTANGNWEVNSIGVIVTGTSTNATVKVDGTWETAKKGIDVRADSNVTLNANITSGDTAVNVGDIEGKVDIKGGKIETTVANPAIIVNGDDATLNISKADVTTKGNNAINIAKGTFVAAADTGTITTKGSNASALYVGTNAKSVTINGGTYNSAESIGDVAYSVRLLV